MMAEASDVRLCLIGGGDFLRTFAHLCCDHGIDFKILLVEDSAHEPLVLEEIQFSQDDRLSEHTEIVSSVSQIEERVGDDETVIAFGSRWIFSRKVLEKCNNRIFNLNLIPIPHYLGAAHFSWQILNNDVQGGIVVQHITMDIDRGRIFYNHTFTATEVSKPVPLDYFHGYVGELKAVFSDILAAVKTDLREVTTSSIDPETIRYFPGLRTLANGHVDWSWNIDEVDRFIRAFDQPYPGAFGLLENGKRIHLRAPTIIEHAEIHPYCSGLITAINSASSFTICAKGGYLKVSFEPENSGMTSIPKLGTRLL